MNSQYKIGDISRLFNLSSEMIRYYEKMGIIDPIRDEKNGYRYYSIFDIYILLECLQYQNLGMKIKEIPNFINFNYREKLQNQLHIFQRRLNKEIDYKVMLKKRVTELAMQLEVADLNLSNYWVKKINKKYAFDFVDGIGDDYDKVNTSEDNIRFLLNDKYINFIDSYVCFNKDKDEWYFAIDEEYFNGLSISYKKKYTIIPAHYCLCTVIEMGPLGQFNHECYEAAVMYAQDKGYHVQLPIRGIIRGRGYEGDHFKRYLEIQIPIIKKSQIA